MSGTLRFCSQALATGGRNVANKSSAKIQGSSVSNIVSNLVKNNTVNHQLTASIVSLAHQDRLGQKIEMVEPFPYRTKRYTSLYLNLPFLDITKFRMNVNSKIIVVDGNIASGKADFARKLAKEFGMFYMSEPLIDNLYVNHNGFDYRTLNKYIAPKLQAVDDKMYYENPEHGGVPWYKMFYYRLRYLQYIDALAHLFNTGQGVVLERSPASDKVFADAMYKNGWLPKDAYDYYYRLRYDTIHWLLRPHLVIYLDSDVDVLHKRIKDRGIDYQVKSKVLTKDYLNEIDQSYKQRYLEDAEIYSHLLIYKWNQPKGDIADVVLDIEAMNFDDWDILGKKFKDWNFYFNSLWDSSRYTYTSTKVDLMNNFERTQVYDVDSLVLNPHDTEHRDEIYKNFVPNYGVQPSLDSNQVGTFQKLFGLINWRDEQEFAVREPFY